MSLKPIILLTVALAFSWGAESEWKIKKVPQKLSDKTLWQLEFTQGKRRLIYRPQTGSKRVLNINEKVVNGKQYFLTGWSHGGRSMQFRIFDPSVKNSPLCEFYTFGESTELRLKKNILQALKVPDRLGVENPENLEDSWVNCRELQK